MRNDTLAEEIYSVARASGFDDCGIIAIDDMDGYKDKLRERMEKVPGSRPFYSRIAGAYPCSFFNGSIICKEGQDSWFIGILRQKHGKEGYYVV